jgi:heptosyltransferase-2
MRYGLLNDVRVLDKQAWPLMVERYVALAYDKGVMASAKDLPQPLLWPQLQVTESEKAQTCAAFSLSAERPLIGFAPALSLVRPSAGHTITMRNWQNS